MRGPSATTERLDDGGAPFDVTVLRAVGDVPTVVFAAGRGGSPTRHLPLLVTLAARGLTVVAPHFEMLAPTAPGRDDLVDRMRRLELTVDVFAEPGQPLSAMGHSIGAMLCLVLAGGRARTRAGDPVTTSVPMDIDRLVLLAPATDFFRWPGALTGVSAPIVAWVGTSDTVTPPAQALFLQDATDAGTPVDVRTVVGADHFTFMDELPPGVPDPHPDRHTFLANLADEAARALLGL